MPKKKIVILGSTGSVGRSTLDVLKLHPSRWEILGLVAEQNIDMMLEQIKTFQPPHVVMTDEFAGEQLQKKVNLSHVCLYKGLEALDNLILLPEVTHVVIATSGIISLKPALMALKAGKKLCIANKEILVMAGHLLKEAGGCLKKGNILPIDSEHVALWQCMYGQKIDVVDQLLLTASGGALQNLDVTQLAHVTAKDILKHPTWSMGTIITVNSATMMNKAFEIMEAHFLFDLPYDKIKAVLHRQSIVHGLVGFIDGTWLAQLSYPDMKTVIQYALTYPDRLPLAIEPLNFFDLELSFAPISHTRYPCFKLAVEACKKGGNLPTVLYAANKVAVNAFLQDDVAFPMIFATIDYFLQTQVYKAQLSLEELLALEETISQQAYIWLQKYTTR